VHPHVCLSASRGRVPSKPGFGLLGWDGVLRTPVGARRPHDSRRDGGATFCRGGTNLECSQGPCDDRYNQGALKRAVALVFALFLLFAIPLFSQTTPATGHTLVVIPFENTSPTPGLEWIGEAFPESLHEHLNSPVLYVTSREERMRAYDRVGIPAGLHPSRATLFRIAEQMDVDYVVLGTYSYDGAQLHANAQLLDMRASSLLPAVAESGPIADLVRLQTAMAWDLLRVMRSDFSIPKERYVQDVAVTRLDAFENHVRGVLATTADEKIRYYKEATRLNPVDARAWLELGETYFSQRSYEAAIAALGQISALSPAAREANFYLGLASYYRADYSRAENAFQFVAARVPLAEVYNNLGVVEARRGRRTAISFFQKAIANDPSDPDYHFNLGLSLGRAADNAGAARELRAALERRPGDAEARSALDAVTRVSPVGSSQNISGIKPAERIKTNYEEDSFRQMTIQLRSWAEQRFARSDPKTHARFHIETGRELLAHGFASEAENEFREAATLDPSSTAALTGLAEVFDARGDAAGARAQAEAALRIHESADAYLVLARLDLRENRTETAARNVNRAEQLEPGNTGVPELKRALAAKLAEKAQP
jgi:tetratricopeptide (TPR) repeat protein/TolB-like protein